MTNRLARCIEAGDVVALFPLLKGWPKDELRALLKDCEAHHQAVLGGIDQFRKEALFKPEVFFSDKATRGVMKAAEDAEWGLLAMLSEICSVAYLYLGDEDEEAA